ncbi:MAG: sulfite exporter TauE/SafE family protein [Phycisphaerae bacterium]|nr:sulfite exporter TauE/SafE family protein [Phycisphaerae bacterium]
MTLAEFGLTDEFMLLAVGLAAGLIGGTLGVGGGILMIPAMVIFLGDQAYGPNSFHVYKLAAISTSIVLSVPAIVRHSRARAIVYPMLPGILPLAAVGVVIGVFAASLFVDEQTRLLRQSFGVFLEFVVLFDVYQEWRALRGSEHFRSTCPMPNRRTLIGLVVGLPAGIIAGLLGVGGGVWAVPAQRQLLGIRIRNAIANSAVAILGIAIVTSAALSYSIHQFRDDHVSPLNGYWLTLWLAPGALIGGWFGASLTHRLPVRWLRYAFQVLLAMTGLKLMGLLDRIFS